MTKYDKVLDDMAEDEDMQEAVMEAIELFTKEFGIDRHRTVGRYPTPNGDIYIIRHPTVEIKYCDEVEK